MLYEVITVFCERTLAVHMHGEDAHRLIAVHDIAVFVAGDQSIRVSVKRKAEVRAVVDDHLLQAFGMRAAALIVDVDAVGCAGFCDDFRAEAFKHLFCDEG